MVILNKCMIKQKKTPQKPHTKKAKISITSYEERFFSKYWIKLLKIERETSSSKSHFLKSFSASRLIPVLQTPSSFSA